MTARSVFQKAFNTQIGSTRRIDKFCRLSALSSALAVSAFAVGCSTHHQRMATHNELASAETIVLTNDHSIDVNRAGYGPENSILSGESRYQISDIKEVETVNHGRGMAQGLGIGFLTGAGIGALIGFTAGDDPPCEDDPIVGTLLCTRLDAGDKAVFLGGIIGVLFAIPGAIAGTITGSSDIYHYQTPKLNVDIKPANGRGQLSLRYRF